MNDIINKYHNLLGNIKKNVTNVYLNVTNNTKRDGNKCDRRKHKKILIYQIIQTDTDGGFVESSRGIYVE